MKVVATAVKAAASAHWAYHGLGAGALIAILVWFLVTGLRPQYLDYPRHLACVVVGGVVGATMNGAFALRGRVDNAYLLSVTVRVGLLSCGIAFCQLAWMQEEPLAVLVFLIWGVGLVLLSSLVILIHLLEGAPELRDPPTDLFRRRMLARATYLPLAMSILLLGVYRSGERTLTLQRDAVTGEIDCQLEARRWLGRVEVQRTGMKGVRDWRPAFAEGEGVVLLGNGDERLFVDGDVAYYHTLAGIIDRTLRDYLKSNQSSAEFTERTGWPLWGYLLAVGLLLLGGKLLDPLVPSSFKGTLEVGE